MSVPFRYKQSYRDLFEFLGNNKDITSEVLDKFASLLDPLFPEATVTKYLEMCPIGVDKFMLFIADGQGQVSVNYDVIIWNYAAKMAQFNLFKGDKECTLKELRSSVDPSLKLHCKEPELTGLYQKHCSAFASGGDAAVVNITCKEVAAMWKELSAKTPLSDLLRALMPKMRGGKSTAVTPPPRGSGRSPSNSTSPISPRSPTSGTASPTSVSAPPVMTPVASSSPVSPPSSSSTQGNNNNAVKLRQSMLEDNSVNNENGAGGANQSSRPSELVVVSEDIPPPPPLETEAAAPPTQEAVAVSSLTMPPTDTTEAMKPTSKKASSAALSRVMSSDKHSNPHQNRRPTLTDSSSSSSSSGKHSPLVGDREAFSPTRSTSPVDKNDDNGSSAFSPPPPSRGGGGKPVVNTSSVPGSYTHKMLELLAQGGAVDGGLVNSQGGVVDSPALPLEVIEFLGGLEKQRCELQEQLQMEVDEIHDCSSAIASMKARRDKLVQANAAYFALRGTDEDGTDLITGKKDSINHRISNPNAKPVPRDASSPFLRIANDRQELLSKMEAWLHKARDENDFLRKEVALARQAMHYDETSAVVGDLLRKKGGVVNPNNNNNSHHHSHQVIEYSQSSASSPRPKRHHHHNNNHHRNNNNNNAYHGDNGSISGTDEEGDVDLPLPPAEIMHSPYRVARFYAKMAKRDKELKEREQERSQMSPPPNTSSRMTRNAMIHPQHGEAASHHETHRNGGDEIERRRMLEGGAGYMPQEEGYYPYKGQMIPEHLFYRHYYDEEGVSPIEMTTAPRHHPQQQQKPSAAAKYWASTTASLNPVTSNDRGGGVNHSDLRGSSFVQRRPQQQRSQHHTDPSPYHLNHRQQQHHQSSISTGPTPPSTAVTKGLETYFTTSHPARGGYY